MDALVDLIKRIGIFMIAAQAVIHFAPDQKYGKYMKLIVSIMILLQFLTPVYGIFTGLDEDRSEWLSDIRMDYSLEEMSGAESTEDALIVSMENEIKSKLNSEAKNQNYRIVNVRVSLRTLQEKDENGFKQYALDNVRVVVMYQTPLTTAAGDAKEDIKAEEREAKYGPENGIEKIQVQKISIEAEQREDTGTAAEDSGQRADVLRMRFAEILGIEEKYMEVSVYGAVEENVE